MTRASPSRTWKRFHMFAIEGTEYEAYPPLLKMPGTAASSQAFGRQEGHYGTGWPFSTREALDAGVCRQTLLAWSSNTFWRRDIFISEFLQQCSILSILKPPVVCESGAGQPSMTSSSSLSQIQCQGKHVIHFSLYLNLKYKVKVSNFRGVPLATDDKIVVRHSLYTPTLNSATFQPSIANPSVCSSMLPQPFRSNGKHSGANPAYRHSSASHSAALDRVRR